MKYEIIQQFKQEQKQIYLKSAFNYVGQKYPILNQILPYFPKKQSVNTFYDLFAGGGSVFINVNYQKIVAVDILQPLVQFYNLLKNNKFQTILENINKYSIKSNDPDGYSQLRKNFNLTKNPYMYYCLIASCNSNHGRFNSKGQFNQTFGKRSVNPNMIQKLQQYHKKIHNIKKLSITHCQFDKLDNIFQQNDLVYCDPPYAQTDAGYNAQWTKMHELRFYDFLKILNKNKTKFIVSNTSIHKGVKNESLINLCQQLKLKTINIDHSYQKVAKKKNDGVTQQVLILNF